VVSVTYDGTGGRKNEVIIPYLRYPRRRRATDHAPLFHARGSAGT
jgi:hypothetical protein